MAQQPAKGWMMVRRPRSTIYMYVKEKKGQERGKFQVLDIVQFYLYHLLFWSNDRRDGICESRL